MRAGSLLHAAGWRLVLVLTAGLAASRPARPDVAPALEPRNAAPIDALLPERGPFRLPPPYGTEAVRLTNASDCGGADCVEYAAAGVPAGGGRMLVFVGLRGAGPTLFAHDTMTGRVRPVGPLFEGDSPYATASGQGWYFSARRPTTLYVTDAGGARLERYDVLARTLETVFDAGAELGAARRIGGAHSSDDDTVHSAVVSEETSGASVGCVVYREGVGQSTFYPARGRLDQCRVDGSGRWLLITDVDASEGEGRVVDLETGAESRLLERAAGGAGRWPAAFRVWDVEGAVPAMVAYRDGFFGAALAPADPEDPPPGVTSWPERACGAVASTRRSGVDPIVCFRVADPGEARAVAPLVEGAPRPGAGRSRPPLGRLDPSGRYFLFTSALAGGRRDVFVAKVPEAGPAASVSAPAARVPPAPARDAATKATDDAGSPDPTLLPVATIAQVPLTAAYNLLQVPAKAAGSAYLDPTTAVKVYKLTSATFPAASPRWGHDYSEGGDEVSLPYSGTTRAVLVRQNGGSWWLVDFTPGVGVGNARPLTGNLAPLMDLAFTFSNNPATPYYAYVSSGATIRRFDVRTMTEAPGGGWPVTGESSAMWLHQSENDGLFVWMRGANGTTVVGYEPATATRKTYTNASLNEPRIDRAGRYIALSMNTPLNGLVVWDWQANAVAWTTTGDPGIPFAHNASLRRRWMTVDWNMSYPPDFAMFTPDVPNSAVHVGGPANGTTIHGNGNWIQHPARLDDQWALFCHYGSLRPLESYWLSPGAMVLVTPSGQRRVLGHPYNTTSDYTFFTFAKFSSDGRYVLFTSDMNGSARSDVFLAEVPSGSSAPDTTPPTVAITAPAGGATVSGSAVTVSASASDDVGVVGVQFRLDGGALGGEDLTAPYGVSWNTTSFPDGAHILTAVARDAAGHATVSAPVAVTVGNAAPPAGLIAYLKLDEGSGTAAADSSGQGHPGTLMNGATWVIGHSGKAVALDGANDVVRVAHAAALDAFPLSAAVWFKTTTQTGVSALVNKYVGGSYNGYQIFFNKGTLCAWYLRDSARFVYDGSGCTLAIPGANDGQWHQAVFVVDAAGGRMYLDGVQRASRPWTGSAGPPTTTQDVGVGFYPGAFGLRPHLRGTVDEIRIYARALSASEVLQLYNGQP